MQDGLDTVIGMSFGSEYTRKEVLYFHSSEVESVDVSAKNLCSHCIHGIGLVQRSKR